MAIPQDPNQSWSLDFVSDSLSDGRRFRVLCVIDDFSRESLACVVETSLSGQHVARQLDNTARTHGYPCMVVSDNGTELPSDAIMKWQEERPVEWHYIAPGKRMQNSFVESFMAPSGQVPQRAPVRQSGSGPRAGRGLARRLPYTRASTGSPRGSITNGQ